MSFNVDMLRSRLSASTEAADSITSTAHWILFHKRHAAVIAEQWAECVAQDKNSLAEIYIANEVIQQSKIKRKVEFVDAFVKVLPRALSVAYSQADLPTRDRITRVVRVWRDRGIFGPDGQLAIENAIKNAGESLMSAVPKELEPLLKHFTALQTAANSPQGASPAVVEDTKAEISKLLTLVDQLAQSKGSAVQPPEIEPLRPRNEEEPSAAAPAAEVYTAETAKQSMLNDQRRGSVADDDAENYGYAESDEETSAPPEKKQRTEVDPKLASFLASISSVQ